MAGYFKRNCSNKLKYLSIDTCFLKNYHASNVAFNGYCRKKRLSKLSLIVDSNGVSITALIRPGNCSDQTLFYKNWNDLYVGINGTNNNKHKRYLLADAIYDTAKIRRTISRSNITPLIAYNKRNCKNGKYVHRLLGSKILKRSIAREEMGLSRDPFLVDLMENGYRPTFIHRDLNGSLNIWYKGWCVINRFSIPEYLKRPKKEETDVVPKTRTIKRASVSAVPKTRKVKRSGKIVILKGIIFKGKQSTKTKTCSVKQAEQSAKVR